MTDQVECPTARVRAAQDILLRAVVAHHVEIRGAEIFHTMAQVSGGRKRFEKHLRQLDRGPAVDPDSAGKTADEVGREAANQLLRAMNSEAAVDRYLADQLIPYLAVAGGTIVSADFTPHLASAMYVAETILGTEFRVEGSRISAPPPA